jgi:ParB/RepB/Spo0J family partition protein
MTAVALVTSESVLRVPLTRLHPSPTNPRKHLGDLTELAASIAQVGVLEPVVARPKGDDFEIAFGHRRVAAAERAGVEDVPVIVRDYSDDEVLEAQIVENNNRSDVHPLDEADGFAALIARGYDIQRLADKIGRPVPYVAQRLKLCGLSKESRKAIDDEQISIGVALLLAKLPSQKLQNEGLEMLLPQGRFDSGQISVAEARKILEEDVMRALKGAPFKMDDASLVPKAGPCTTCPKRTGVQVDLFADASSPDLCTDPKCFREKTDAVWQIKSKEHKAAGGEVLNQKDTQALLGGGYSSDRRALQQRYKKLDDHEYVGSKRKTVRQILGKELPPVTLARDPESGAIVELVSAKDVHAATSKATRDDKPAKTSISTAERKRKEQDAIKADARRRLVAKLVEAVESRTVWKGVEVGLLRGLAMCVLTSTWSEYHRQMAKRRGWLDAPAESEDAAKPKKKTKSTRAPALSSVDDVIEQRIESADASELAGVIVEGLIARELPASHRDEIDTGAALICQVLGVSYEKELAAAQKEHSAKAAVKSSKKLIAKAKAKAKPKAKAKAKARKK